MTTTTITAAQLKDFAIVGKKIAASKLSNPMTLCYDKEQFILVWNAPVTGLRAIIFDENALLEKLNSGDWIIIEG
jgi:hypothetical protein